MPRLDQSKPGPRTIVSAIAVGSATRRLQSQSAANGGDAWLEAPQRLVAVPAPPSNDRDCDPAQGQQDVRGEQIEAIQNRPIARKPAGRHPGVESSGQAKQKGCNCNECRRAPASPSQPCQENRNRHLYRAITEVSAAISSSRKDRTATASLSGIAAKTSGSTAKTNVVPCEGSKP